MDLLSPTLDEIVANKSNNIVFEAEINEMQSGSKMWLDLDVPYRGFMNSFQTRDGHVIT